MSDNVQLIKDMGFTRVEIDICGKSTFWWASPTIINEHSGEPEAIFQEGTFENDDFARLILRITCSAMNNGMRRGRIQVREQLSKELDSTFKKLVKKVKKDY